MNIYGQKGMISGVSPHSRTCARFSIPGATVSLRMKRFGLEKPAEDTQERLPLIDISRGGLSFLTDSPPRRSHISIMVRYSDTEDPIPLEGNVSYSLVRGAGLSYRYRVGVEFIPFSPRRGHNTIESLTRLERLEATYVAEGGQPEPLEN
jgi:hypothetical protein